MNVAEALAWLGPIGVAAIGAALALVALAVYAEHRRYIRNFTPHDPGRHRAEAGDRQP